MGLPRDLVELEAYLREVKLDPFAPNDASGIMRDARCAALAERMPMSGQSASMRLCLQALRVQHDELRPRLVDAELVATLPTEMPGIARPTERVVTDMITKATTEIILLGYELTDRALVAQLAEAAGRDVDVVMICDRGRGAARRIAEAWPHGVRAPRVFHDREREDGAPYASMHAKCLLVDAKDLLVTSANFTFHGLHGNIEIGVRIGGPPAAEARKVFSHLVEHRIVEECT